MHDDHSHGSVIRLNRTGDTVPSPTPPIRPQRHRRGSALWRHVTLGLLAIALGCAALWLFVTLRPQPVQQVTVTGAGTGPTTLSLDEVVAAVGSHIMLPQGETPTMAAVSDLTPLQGQAFFARASVGDIVLMYPKAQRAFLYSPKLGKLIEVAPLTLTQ